MRPKRIQRKRTKGWRMPEGAVYVGRPSKWGNPIQVGAIQAWENGATNERKFTYAASPAQAVEQFRFLAEADVENVRAELAGKILACWCPLDQPCHADVLLEIANRDAP